MTPALLEALLAPISPDLPKGADTAYSQEWDDIRRLREGDDPYPQGEWVREIQTPQWPKVRDLCESLLKTKSKDLQVSCWYAESMIHLEGFPGLTFGLKVLDGLLSRYWEAGPSSMFPEDVEERIGRFDWLNAKLPMVIRSVPMTSPKVGGYSHVKWEESRLVENNGARDAKAKEQDIAEGKLSGEAWDKAASASGQGFYIRLYEQVQGARQTFEELERRIDQRFSQDAPNLNGVREALKACHELANQMLKRFGVDPQIEAAAAAAAPTINLDHPVAVAAPAAAPSGPIASRADAIRKLREVAKYFRDHEPHSPVGPLAERAARWGEMPLEQWLSKVIKDDSTLNQLRDLLDLQPEM
jgi:type VI secretion system protein ImpA